MFIVNKIYKDFNHYTIPNLNTVSINYKMKYFKVIKSPYSNKFNILSEEFTSNMVFEYANINKIKNFLVSKHAIAESKIQDYTDSTDLSFDIYYIDTTNSDAITYVSEYIDHILSPGEYFNVTPTIQYPNTIETIRKKIRTIKPITELEDNKIYAILEIRQPIAGIIQQSNIIPCCYINIYENIIKYNPTYVRFYANNRDPESFSLIYPPIFIFPHIKNIIIENMVYNKLYDEYYFNIDVVYRVDNIGNSPIYTQNLLRYRYTFGLQANIKNIFEKYLLELIFSLPTPRYKF